MLPLKDKDNFGALIFTKWLKENVFYCCNFLSRQGTFFKIFPKMSFNLVISRESLESEHF